MNQSQAAHHKRRVVSASQRALSVWGGIVIAWAFYRSTIGSETPIMVDELIVKPILFLVPVIYYITQQEHKSLLEGLWLKSQTIWKEIAVALLLSVPIIALFLGIFLFQGVYLDTQLLLNTIIISAAVSVTEEVLSRGFITRVLWEEGNNTLKALVQGSLLHLFLRIPRIMTMPEIFGQKLVLFFISDLFLSSVITGLFLWRRNLLGVILIRFVYTVFIMTLLLR